jgi:hypothetical protein
MYIRRVLTACVLLASAGTSRADDPAAQDIPRLREEIAALRKQVATLQDQLVQKEKLLAATIRIEELRRKDVLELRRALEKAQKENLRLLAQTEGERKKRIQAEITSTTIEARSLRMEEQLRQLSRELTRVKAGASDAAPKRGGPNPPAGDIQGKITAVDKASGLLRISVGSDAGLKTGHTLEVLRLGGTPAKSMYLGRVQVVAVRPTEAVARLVVGRSAEAGDQVVSKLPPP